MKTWAERHADGIALTMALIAGLLFCVGIVVMGVEWG